jgi:hypothetical protein
VWSADVFAESQDSPWSKPPSWSGEAARAAVEFIAGQKGPSDTLLVCDGRSRAVRRELETIMETARYVSELWVVYTPTRRLGRRVSFSSDNREVLLLSSCVSRTCIPAKERAMYTGAGETSTHATSYTKVDPAPWASLPQIKAEDKTKIVGCALAVPQGNVYDCSCGMPLFWAERKPVAFWSQLLMDLDAKCIVDLSPGSGSLARAALLTGVQYLGIVRAPEHASWLQNVLDRCSLEQMTKNGSPLFEQDLAQCIAEHFQDVLDQLHEAEGMEDTPPEGEV